MSKGFPTARILRVFLMAYVFIKKASQVSEDVCQVLISSRYESSLKIILSSNIAQLLLLLLPLEQHREVFEAYRLSFFKRMLLYRHPEMKMRT